MAQPTLWKNVAVAMQSALATALPITAITKASPGVATITGTVPADGAFVQIGANGMRQVDGRVFRVDNPVGQAFALEGEDTTNYDTFVSGGTGAQVITFGTSLTTATNVSAAGGDFDFVDTTTIHDNKKSQIPGLPNASTYTFDCIWDPADPGLAAMKAASDQQAMRAFKFTFPNGRIMVFTGYVGASLLPGGQGQQLVTTQVTITMFGSPTYYAS